RTSSRHWVATRTWSTWNRASPGCGWRGRTRHWWTRRACARTAPTVWCAPAGWCRWWSGRWQTTWPPTSTGCAPPADPTSCGCEGPRVCPSTACPLRRRAVDLCAGGPRRSVPRAAAAVLLARSSTADNTDRHLSTQEYRVQAVMEDHIDVGSGELRALAAAHGVATEFWDYRGNHRQVPAGTLRAVLAAMDVLADTDHQVQAALAATETAPWRRTLPPCLVLREGTAQRVPVHVPDGTTVRLRVHLEDGSERELEQLDGWVEPQEIDGQMVGLATFDLPADLPPGWHELAADVGQRGTVARSPLAITPARLPMPELRADQGDRAWGLMAQLYSVRSAGSWGFGDLADLMELTSLSGQLGGDFLLINPLHAAEPSAPMTPSPYLPTTRRFLNPVYIRPEDIRETAYLPNSQRTLLEWALDALRPMNTDAGPIDRDAVWAEKKSALETIFAFGRSPARQRSLDRFRAEQGRGLEDFALWCAVAEQHTDGQPWPLDDVSPGAVGRVREELAERIDFFCWLQWIADEQLERAQRTALEAGMGIGVMQDLAVGVHPRGADSWSMAGVLARGITVGAPPDMYNQQ